MDTQELPDFPDLVQWGHLIPVCHPSDRNRSSFRLPPLSQMSKEGLALMAASLQQLFAVASVLLEFISDGCGCPAIKESLSFTFRRIASEAFD
jgi:hypothetical protein